MGAVPQEARVTELLRKFFRGPIIVNGGYDRSSAERALVRGVADLVAIGVPFIANPDLVERLRTGAPLSAPDPTTFYGGGEKGYTDYPVAVSLGA